MKTRTNIVLIIIGAMLSIGIFAPVRDQLKRDQDEYCEMVALFKQTEGRSGWPDYRGLAEVMCK